MGKAMVENNSQGPITGVEDWQQVLMMSMTEKRRKEDLDIKIRDLLGIVLSISPRWP